MGAGEGRDGGGGIVCIPLTPSALWAQAGGLSAATLLHLGGRVIVQGPGYKRRIAWVQAKAEEVACRLLQPGRRQLRAIQYRHVRPALATWPRRILSATSVLM